MRMPCDDLVPFADGELELEPARAEAFRSHLRTCAACRAGLLEAMQLSARLGAVALTAEHVKPMLAPDRPAESSEEAGSSEETALAPDAPVGSSEVTVLDLWPRSGRSTPTWRQRLVAWSGGAVASAAVIMLALHVRTEPAAMNPFAGIKARPYDTRTALASAAPYLPVPENMRGAGGPARDRISLETLGALDKRHDEYALAIAFAWNGELTEAAEHLRVLEPTPSVRSDSAALEIVMKSNQPAESNDSFDSLLAELEVLGSGDDLAARAAQWNHAILLSQQELPYSAARAFRAIANQHEVGWADEARKRAEREEKRGADVRDWNRADEAGKALRKTGAPVPTELVRRFPGVIRAHFYDAVSAAPSRARVLELAPLAAELDQRGDHPILSDYLGRVANLDFRRRAPLARAYAQLLDDGARPAPEIYAKLTSPTASAHVVDIVMAAMFQLDAVPDHLEAFRRMAKQLGDPWFEIILAEGEATAEERRNNWLGAEARLREAQKLCSPATHSTQYRCLSLASRRGSLYQKLHRVPEAIEVLQSGLREARSSGEWGRYSTLLWGLADVERFNSSMALARAYANEVLLMAMNPAVSRAAHMTLAAAAVRGLDGRAARRALDLALKGGEPDIPAANCLADIARLDPRPGDLVQLQSWLRRLRASGLTAGYQVLADEIEGRLLIESDRTAGIAVLERAIAKAGVLPRDLDATRARTGSYSVLVFDAARNGDTARVMAFLAEQLGLPQPGPCTVGMVAEDERAVVVVRGADGQDHARYQAARRSQDGALTVPPELARGLEGCTHVGVMANAMLQGQPRVLPATLPWSYTADAHRRALPSGKAPTAPRTLIVADVIPPAHLQLPALSYRPSDPTPSTVTLSGSTATPARVLAEMPDATEIQFHTHGLVNAGISDASHLVLSPGPEGNYALTAEAIRHTELRGHPIVVLAACQSALGARYQHAPWSLPDSFLAIGARAVFAPGTRIPDLEAGPFFDHVLERVRAGADPAVALRDERMAALTSTPSTWAADVILFE